MIYFHAIGIINEGILLFDTSVADAGTDDEDTGEGPQGLSDIYSTNMLDTTLGKTWDQMTPAERVASQKRSRPTPLGETAPMPVTTTRRPGSGRRLTSCRSTPRSSP